MKKNNLDEIINQKCAPSKSYDGNSCLSIKSLKKIADNYNKKTSLNDEININLSKELLVKEIESKLTDQCSNQVCWLRLDFVKELEDDDIINNTFRPIGPNKKYDWLSTTHINEVIEQYQYSHNDFLFLGAVPYDFEILSILGLNNIDFDELEKNNKAKIGLVINLDEHYKEGSHWVSLYADLKKNQIYFFDSVGKPPYKRIRKFINKIVKYLYYKKYNVKLRVNDVINKIQKINKLDPKNLQVFYKKYNYINNLLKTIDIRYNNIQHQFKNSECGVYSINFITRLIDGESFNSIINNIKKDEEMNSFRKVYFNNVN